MTHSELEGLLPFCTTDTQRKYIKAWMEQKSYRKAAVAVGVSRQNFHEVVTRVKKLAETRGYAPNNDMTRPVPESYMAKGVSTLYNAAGEVSAQWVKATLDDKRYMELIREASLAFCEDIKPSKPVTAPKQSNSELLNMYAITDYHFGMKSWGEECGADWDLKIAEELIVGWFGAAIKQSPDAETALLAFMGDLLHFDGLEALTPTGGNILDADTRFQLVVRVAIRSIRKIVSLLLQKHKRVHIQVAEGNHDIASSVWLREMMAALYSEEPRVSIDQSPDIYYCYEHGLTSIFVHHGHKTKFENLDAIMVAKFRDVFGRTKYSYAHLGHYHHNRVKESNMMTIEQHRTLAAPDAYASRHGYSSGREAKVITYHKKYGEIGRLSITPEMVA